MALPESWSHVRVCMAHVPESRCLKPWRRQIRCLIDLYDGSVHLHQWMSIGILSWVPTPVSASIRNACGSEVARQQGRTCQMRSRMRNFLVSDDTARAMYAGGRGNAAARRFARLWRWVFAAGLLPRRWVTLEVRGRRSGMLTRFPLGMADVAGRWYLVSMLGENCNWVRNVRAAHGRVVLRRRSARTCQLVEVPQNERAVILRRYVDKVPGGRPHIPVDKGAPLADFAAVAASYPVFEVNGLCP